MIRKHLVAPTGKQYCKVWKQLLKLAMCPWYYQNTKEGQLRVAGGEKVSFFLFLFCKPSLYSAVLLECQGCNSEAWAAFDASQVCSKQFF